LAQLEWCILPDLIYKDLIMLSNSVKLAFSMGFNDGSGGKVYKNPFDTASPQYVAYCSGWNSAIQWRIAELTQG
jgi:hypothetical protein